MPVHNSQITTIFEQIADLLEIKGANVFRVRAYRNGAQSISNLSINLSDMVKEGEDLTELSGIGDDLAAKIEEIIRTGECSYLEELKEELSPGLLDILEIPRLGPKRVKTIYDELGIDDVDDLEKAAQEHQIQELSGFGKKTEQNILEGIQDNKKKKGVERHLLFRAEEYVADLIDYLENKEGVNKVTAAGSFRRRKETIGDIDLLVTCEDREKTAQAFVDYEDVKEITAQGEKRSAVILKSGLQVDLRIIDEEQYGSALMYFTGSQAHNVVLRQLAQDQGLKLSEYGVFDGEDNLASATEEEVYQALGLNYITPELRENNGEVKAAQNEELPELVTVDEIKGDLQMHTTASDGDNTLKEMVEGARAKGYEYLAITDHSQRVSVAGGLDEEELLAEIEKMEQLNQEYDGFEILKSCEVDILKDGTMDLADEVLEKLDVVVASTHFYRDLDKAEQTERIVKGLKNPHVNILAHPTGRIIGKRTEMEMDLEKIMKTAVEEGCFLEINASPKRLDLSDKYCRLAKDLGLKLVISTDAHSVQQLDNMYYGVDQARRGWLTADDIINTRDVEGLKKLLDRE
ncbi:DNA polymerase/3'-5' exonuclease PolX [Halanaerobacter jeridensis]|uniref:DNA polymerase beta n=1 Tax=Halanaerobacter jeridensis TaxID=706427 RepID=A0A938XZD3_9FIRM|nr:DNA polymerase/3'-5' exonuclease PolX [Halanaerobacter jeridensis]MBM7558105.1 DNA polymerase (family 10) [Halanaerobacter jeridensis]